MSKQLKIVNVPVRTTKVPLKDGDEVVAVFEGYDPDAGPCLRVILLTETPAKRTRKTPVKNDPA